MGWEVYILGFCFLLGSVWPDISFRQGLNEEACKVCSQVLNSDLFGAVWDTDELFFLDSALI